MNYSNPNNPLNKIEDFAGALALFVAFVLLILQVIMRFILKISIPTLEEYSLYLFIWYTFLTASDAMLTNTHIRVEAVTNLIPPKGRSVIYLIAQIINVAFSAVFAYNGISCTAKRFLLHSASTTGFPMWIVWLVVPVCMGLTCIRSVQYIYYTIRYELKGDPLPSYLDPNLIEIDGVTMNKDDLMGGDP